MTALLALGCILAQVDVAPLDTKAVQLVPVPAMATRFERSAGQNRAVVLVNGLRWRDFLTSHASVAEFASWQHPKSALVQTLKKDADLFAFAYGQNVSVDRVAASAGLADGIRRVRQLGYKELVLVGHSAGGIVARQFVEDHPDTGVTRVIQVATPNGGSDWAKALHEPFFASLTKRERQASMQARADKKIPAGVEFVCVVSGMGTDGVVQCRCQWTEDLQRQGIPAVALHKNHHNAIASQAGADIIARLVRDDQPRWDAAKVAAEKKKILHEADGPK
jgi:triacylglycerol esterase/lipase EstA (alpha/beta hydrolase family)